MAVRRMKDFAAILQPSIPESSSHPASTGSSCIRFTPDSSKLVLATALSSYVLIIDLTDGRPKVLRRFEHHRIKGMGRVLRGKLASSRNEKGHVNGHAINGDGDVEMAERVSPSPSIQPNGMGGGDAEDEDEHSSGDVDDDDAVAIANINRIAISADGQWLATSDSHARSHIFNLDSISVRSSFFFTYVSSTLKSTKNSTTQRYLRSPNRSNASPSTQCTPPCCSSHSPTTPSRYTTSRRDSSRSGAKTSRPACPES